MTTNVDMIDHPPHYITPTGIEAIDVMEQYGLGLHLGNSMKYLLRAGRKGERVDCLRKSEWYVKRWKASPFSEMPAAELGAGESWHTPEEIVAAFGLSDTHQGKAVWHILRAAASPFTRERHDGVANHISEALIEIQKAIKEAA